LAYEKKYDDIGDRSDTGFDAGEISQIPGHMFADKHFTGFYESSIPGPSNSLLADLPRRFWLAAGNCFECLGQLEETKNTYGTFI